MVDTITSNTRAKLGNKLLLQGMHPSYSQNFARLLGLIWRLQGARSTGRRQPHGRDIKFNYYVFEEDNIASRPSRAESPGLNLPAGLDYL
jgi:hypothetical protein